MFTLKTDDLFLVEYVCGETAFLLIRDGFTRGFTQKNRISLCLCFLLLSFLPLIINYGQRFNVALRSGKPRGLNSAARTPPTACFPHVSMQTRVFQLVMELCKDQMMSVIKVGVFKQGNMGNQQ